MKKLSYVMFIILLNFCFINCVSAVTLECIYRSSTTAVIYNEAIITYNYSSATWSWALTTDSGSSSSIEYDGTFSSSSPSFYSNNSFSNMINNKECPTTLYYEGLGYISETIASEEEAFCFSNSSSDDTKCDETLSASVKLYNIASEEDEAVEDKETYATCSYSDGGFASLEIYYYKDESWVIKEYNKNVTGITINDTWEFDNYQEVSAYLSIEGILTIYSSKMCPSDGYYQIDDLDVNYCLQLATDDNCDDYPYEFSESEESQTVTNSSTYTYDDATFTSGETVDLGCEGLLGETDDPNDTAYYLQMALDIMKYVAIVALIGLSIVDYMQAAASSDADAFKKANSKALKRLLYTVILFVFPTVLKFIFELTGIYSDPFCGLDV